MPVLYIKERARLNCPKMKQYGLLQDLFWCDQWLQRRLILFKFSSSLAEIITHTHLCEERKSKNQEVLPTALGGYFEIKKPCSCGAFAFLLLRWMCFLIIVLPNLLKKLCAHCPIIHSRLNSTQCIYPDFTSYGTRFFLSFIYPFIYSPIHPSIVMF